MQPIGSDRVRVAGERVILLSSISKGWTPRTPKTLTHAEYPGTTVLWEERYFEVVEAATQPSGGVRYVLAPWREEHTIRTFESYDAESEARRIADHERAKKQRRASIASRLSGMFLGHLPHPVQEHLQNELGVMPTRITLLSCIPPMLLVGTAAYFTADAMLKQTLSPVPLWAWAILFFLALESFIRFFVVMSQGRGMGSLAGALAYIVYYAIARDRRGLPSPWQAKGESVTFTLPPSEDVALRDSLQTRGALLALLPADEQRRVAARYGWDYRPHAFGVAWILLVFSVIGAVSSYTTLQAHGGCSALVSLLVAAAVAIEQVGRLLALQRGPAGSIFGVVARPFVRDLLR